MGECPVASRYKSARDMIECKVLRIVLCYIKKRHLITGTHIPYAYCNLMGREHIIDVPHQNEGPKAQAQAYTHTIRNRIRIRLSAELYKIPLLPNADYIL
jgi:hypothetical protein